MDWKSHTATVLAMVATLAALFGLAWLAENYPRVTAFGIWALPFAVIYFAFYMAVTSSPWYQRWRERD